MNRTQIVSLILATLIAGTFFLAAIRPQGKKIEGKVNIVASFYPLAYIASSVGGSYVSVENLLPSGGEPHDFEPSSRDIALLGEKELLIFNGGHLEPWIDKWAHGGHQGPHTELPRALNMVEELAKRQVPLIERNGVTDPHIWLDPLLFKQEVEIIRDALVAIDPVHEDEYRANAERLMGSLDLLDQHFREDLQECKKQDIIVSHDAFRYLARRYNFSTIPIAGISPDEEPSPKDLVKIADLARSKNIGYIFFETNISSKLSETIAREVGAQTLVLNPLESLTVYEIQSGEDYASVMHKNSSNLHKALLCQ